MACVYREGRWREGVPLDDLVPGDLLALRPGITEVGDRSMCVYIVCIHVI